MAENPNSQAPETVFETLEMTAKEIAATNAAYKAMGLNYLVIDVSRFCAKLERQSDGTYRRSLIRRSRRTNEAGTNSEQPAGQ